MIKDDIFKVHPVVLKSNMKAVLSSVNLALATCFGHYGYCISVSPNSGIRQNIQHFLV